MNDQGFNNQAGGNQAAPLFQSQGPVQPYEVDFASWAAAQVYKDDAARFLSAFETDRFTFQTINPKGRAFILNGTLDQHFATLVHQNSQGAGIYVTINRTDLRGRKNKNIVRIDAFPVDTDGADPQNFKRLPFDPSIIIESSAGNFWFWYLLEDGPMLDWQNNPAACEVIKEDYKCTVDDLARLMESDPKIKSLPHVGRLPGFLHMKNAPRSVFVSRIVYCRPEIKYKVEEFKAELAKALVKYASVLKPRPRAKNPGEGLNKVVQQWQDGTLVDPNFGKRASQKGKQQTQPDAVVSLNRHNVGDAMMAGKVKDPAPSWSTHEDAKLRTALARRDETGKRVWNPDDDRDVWAKKVAPAIASLNWGEKGENAFIWWSRQATKPEYQPGGSDFADDALCRSTIRSYKPTRGPRDATEGMIYKRAYDDGWDGEPEPAILAEVIALYDSPSPQTTRLNAPSGGAVPLTDGPAAQPQDQAVAGPASADAPQNNTAADGSATRSAPNAPVANVTLDDFYSYLPMHQYFHIPTRALWPASSVDSKIAPLSNDVSATMWLDDHRSVEQMTWSPGEPLLIHDQFIAEGGWFPHPGAKVINTYRPPTIAHGDASQAGPWIKHVEIVFGEYAERIILYLAQRVQRPSEKINHALVLGGSPGVGKDVMLVPVRHAVGPWNFMEVSPKQVLGRFNGFLKSVILRVSEARDLGEVNQFAFYDATKTMIAAPPEVHRIDEKNIKEYSILNISGTIISSNYKHGLYLPANDRRHYVAWSELTMEDFEDAYWQKLFQWYEDGGIGHVAAFLATLDIKGFNPKAPPPKTPAFWAVVDTHRATENSELDDVLDRLGRPDVVALEIVKNAARGAQESMALGQWLDDRKNRRAIPHRMEECGYVKVPNPDADDGLWKLGNRRQTIYGRTDLSPKEQLNAVVAALKQAGWADQSSR